MIRNSLAAILAVLLFALISVSANARNLLKNPGFEDTAGWSNNWIIKDANGGNKTYHYRLGAEGGGHGDARPRMGANAVEIYSSDRQTYLAQNVSLTPGKYRLSAWARTNGTPDYAPVHLRIGEKMAVVPLATERYKLIWADFQIDGAGDYEVSFFSASYGIALDDLSLERITSRTADPPALHIDLYPSSKDRSANIQYCLKGKLQWVNFVLTCLDQQRLKQPEMRISALHPVKLSGLNESLINHYRVRAEDDVKVESKTVELDGRKYQQFSFALPRFVFGYDHPMYFGGFWVSNVPARDGKVVIEIVDGDLTLAREEMRLVTVDPPKVYRTPKRFYTFAYAVQNWMQAKDERIKALPEQFAMMGLNVWSDYGLSAEKPTDGLTTEELVLKEAYEKYGIRQFWPNFSSMMETSGGGCYSDISGKIGDKDMCLVTRDGKTLDHMYNFNYAANKGKAWLDSAIVAWTRTQKRPIEKGLPFRYSGFVNDGLEGMAYSYDPTTLATFASFKGVDVKDVSIDKLSGEWNCDWQLFNMDLYTRVVDVWVEALRQNDPNVKIVNTASTFGPGGFADLTPAEHMQWARSLDYNMPQWYASHYYGSAYADHVRRGDEAKVYGKHNNGVDVIPLLYLSMGGPLEDVNAIRFKMLDFLSDSKSVKGIGYYIGTYAFSDASFMVGLSRVHTLLADIEDFYADGVREDDLVKVTEDAGDDNLIPGMDMDGQQIMVKPESSTNVRVHKLNQGKRIALITVITYSEQKAGGKVTLEIDTKSSPGGGKGLVLIDRLTGKKRGLTPILKIDTNKSNNVAVFEIAQK